MFLAKFFSHPRNIILVTLSILIALLAIKFITNGRVLGQKAGPPSTPTPITFSPSISPSAKSTYSIALYGDSMVDTMGENLEYLQKALAAEYPDKTFKLYNYGIGSQNIQDGLARFEKDFANKERKYASIVNLKPDIIILGTFAYNPFPQHSPSKHLELYGQLVTKAFKVTRNTYVLVEIAPLGLDFGKGEHGVNWPQDIAQDHARKIIKQLENGQTIAKARNLPLVDTYTESKSPGGEFGIKTYVNGDDGIHPSVQGHVLMANLIARALKL